MKPKPLLAARWHLEYIERVDQISPATGKPKRTLLSFTDQMPEHYLGTIMQSHDWSHRLRLEDRQSLSLSDLRSVTKRIEHLDAQATQARLQETQAPR